MRRQQGTNINLLFVLLQVFDDLRMTKCRDRVLLPDALVGLGDRQTSLRMMEDLIATDIDGCVRRDRRLNADEEAVTYFQVMHRHIIEKAESFSMKILHV